MKKSHKIIRAVIVCMVVIIVLSNFICYPIRPLQVYKVVLETYDHRDVGEVKLTMGEAWRFITLYNRSIPGGEVNAEPCCDSYRFEVHFIDGSGFSVAQGALNKVIVNTNGIRYYLANQELIDYAYELAERYDLPID